MCCMKRCSQRNTSKCFCESSDSRKINRHFDKLEERCAARSLHVGGEEAALGGKAAFTGACTPLVISLTVLPHLVPVLARR